MGELHYKNQQVQSWLVHHSYQVKKGECLLYKSATVKLTVCGIVLLKTVVSISDTNVCKSMHCILCVSYGILCSDGYFLFHDGLEQGACSCNTFCLTGT